MTETLVLPLDPLEGRVLFPGQDLHVHLSSETAAAALVRSSGPSGTPIAAVADIEHRERLVQPRASRRGGAARN